MMKINRWLLVATVVLVGLAFLAPAAMAQAKKPSLDAWKPAFDYSGAKYKIKVSNVSHPAIQGVYAGFAMRDELWKQTNGQIYFEYLPFSMLGGEVEVLNQVQMGAIQGQSASSVAAGNLGPRMGLVNLPFLVNTPEKLDKFVANEKLFQHFLDAMEHQGIMGLDITAYGTYGWATTTPVKSLEDARKVKFRIAESAVNKMLYQAWGVNPVVMPWPDVPTALKQGVIDGLDHTHLVCFLDKKFDTAKFYTNVGYAQGLFIWIFNKAWFKSLPADLQKTFVKVVKEQAAVYREAAKAQAAETKQAAIDRDGVTFFDLPAADLATMQKLGDPVHQAFAKDIGADYLKQVQEYMGYGK
jgi:TRAP-type C4-dicarboxylate transport system substrate-binding protein